MPISDSSSSFRTGISSPCAACRMLRRRCGEKCVLAPYFPSNDIQKFATAHRIFGASNIIKFLQELPRELREDAVTSIVYESGARIRDPVYGCAGVICHMQRQISQLQSQLASAHAEILTMRLQQANLLAMLTGSAETIQPFSPTGSATSQESDEQHKNNDMIFSGEDPLELWDSLWTHR